ncbi:hypothetical protein ElyMa_000412200 [Elysia marginata]|uniref:Uncharacterized protein n=1 Tax=Elysia marginata TaxID=1093978 RepID=A0AAV4FLK1_9GAST|nr:hypothetical protein ElyMa_000412200 [Elysia marginata]
MLSAVICENQHSDVRWPVSLPTFWEDAEHIVECLVHALTTAVTHRVERRSSRLVNTQKPTECTNHLRFKICTLISVQAFRNAKVSDESQEGFGSGLCGHVPCWDSHSKSRKMVCDHQNILGTILRSIHLEKICTD